jgi:drug/metabolite transporter (DMT)-like permease
MNKRALRADILLLLTAVIWGFGFVAQRSGMEHVGPFAYNGIRFILGSISLLPFIFFRRGNLAEGVAEPRQILLPSLAAGSCLFFAVVFQQFGIIFTTAGNAGFITGLYVVLTPIFGIFLGRKTGYATWIGSALTLFGLYFISVVDRPSINPGDIIVVVSAFFWAAHVLVIDHLMQGKTDVSIDPLELSSGQFAVCGIFFMICAFLVEPYVSTIIESINPSLLSEGVFSWQPFPALISAINAGIVSFPTQAIIPILYGGLGSVGIAYTLQVIAQRDAPPAHATIILCFEGCFAVLGGVLLLSEKAGAWTLLGFLFMLAGMIATQWEVIVKKSN